MLIGVLYWAWIIVAFPPRPFTSMGLCVERAESFRTLGLKRSVKSVLGYARVRFDREGRGRKEKGVTVKWEKKHQQGSAHVCSQHLTTKAPGRRIRDSRSNSSEKLAALMHDILMFTHRLKEKKKRWNSCDYKNHDKSLSIYVIFTYIKILFLHAYISIYTHIYTHAYIFHAQWTYTHTESLFIASIHSFKMILQSARKCNGWRDIRSSVI